MSKISIILPAKNAAEFIVETIDSIISQSFEDWECICVNDNSDDSTLKLLNDLAHNESRLKIYSNPHSGVITALQFGYEKSSGELITRMDADDLMPPNKLELLLGSLNGEKGIIATGKVRYFNALGAGFLKYEQWLNSLIDEDDHWKHIYKECVIASPNWLIHREDFDKAGAFNSDIYPEDYELVFRFCESGLIVKAVNEVTHLWRDHKNRASRISELYMDNTFISLKMKYFKKMSWDRTQMLILWGAGKKGKEVAKALQRERIPFKWVTNNIKKIGHNIYGTILEEASVEGCVNSQVMVAISSPPEQEELKSVLIGKGLRLGEQCFIVV